MSTPIATPKSTMLMTFSTRLSPPSRKRESAMVLSTPKIKAGILRLPLKNLSENQPESTVPKIPNRALMPITVVASSSE